MLSIRYFAMLMVATGLLIWSMVTVQGEETPVHADMPVAVVNGQAITLRTLEDHLLAEEGFEAVLKLVENQLRQAQWERLSDDATIVAMGNWKLPRNVLAAQLLNQNGGAVRDQLIQIALIEQALREEGIIIGDLLLQAERERMEERFTARLVEMDQPQIPFAQFIQQTQSMTMEEFMAQPGFRMLAGLHALVLRRTTVSEEQLKAFYETHKDSFGHPEQVRLQAILLDFEVSTGADGRPFVRDEHRERLRLTAAQLQRQISTGGASFARQWELWGSARDPQAGPGGDVGWVGSDGLRAQKGARSLPRRLVEEALKVATDGQLPRMLPVVEYQDGMVIAQVTDYRAAKELPFDAVRDQLRRRYLEAHMEQYSQDIMHKLRAESEIDYESLGRIVHHRNQEMRRLTQPGLTGEESTEESGETGQAP